MQCQEIKNLLDARQLDAAEKVLLASNLPSAEALPLKIRLLFLRKNYKTALEIVEDMLRSEPSSPIAYRWKAEILDDGFHDFKASIESSSKAIQLDPSYAEAYVVRGNTKRWMTPADNDGAIEDYNSAIKYDPNNSLAYSGIGWVLLEIPEKLDDALQKFTIALCHNKNNFAAYQGVSVVFYRKGQLPKAIEYINKAIDLNPDAYYLYQTRALYKGNLDQPPKGEICDDYCLAYKKVSCKKDFNFSDLFDSAYDSDNLEKVAELLWEEIDNIPEREDILNFHILLLSAAKDEWRDLILSKGIPAEYQAPSGRVLFHEIIALCDCEVVKKIDPSKKLICKVNELGLTPLAVAVKSEKIDIGKYLLSKGSSADEMIAFPWMTPFAMAITMNKIDWIDLFLKKGVNINRPLKKIGSYLSLACSLGHWDIAEKLLANGANPNHSGLTGDVQPLRFCDKSNGFATNLLMAGAHLEYSQICSDSIIKERTKNIQKNIAKAKNSTEMADFSVFFSHLRTEFLTDEEKKLLTKAHNSTPPSLSYDENYRFAMNLLCSCISDISWPKEDSYPLVELPPEPAANKENKIETDNKKSSSATIYEKKQAPKKQICPEVAWIGFIPFWICTGSFISALFITVGIYVGLCVIKSVMGGGSR